MATKWSTISISNYAAATVTDDGAATEANKVKYSTIRTDLTNPLNSALGSALTSLTEVFNDATIAKSGTYTTTATDHARTIECTSTFTLSLLAAATGGAGYRVRVKNAGTGVITVARSGADTIDGATSYALAAGDSATFEVNAAASSYSVLAASGSIDRTSSSTGHTILPGGILLNWARIAFSAATGPNSATWSKAFSATPYVAMNGRDLDVNAHVDLSTFNTTTIGATLSTAGTGTVYVLAIGPA